MISVEKGVWDIFDLTAPRIKLRDVSVCQKKADVSKVLVKQLEIIPNTILFQQISWQVIWVLPQFYTGLLFCERKQVVGNLSNHHPVLTNDLKSDYNQCELVSGFHQLSINEYCQGFIHFSDHICSSRKENKNIVFLSFASFSIFFSSRHHSDQMFEGSQVSKVTLVSKL